MSFRAGTFSLLAVTFLFYGCQTLPTATQPNGGAQGVDRSVPDAAPGSSGSSSASTTAGSASASDRQSANRGARQTIVGQSASKQAAKDLAANKQAAQRSAGAESNEAKPQGANQSAGSMASQPAAGQPSKGLANQSAHDSPSTIDTQTPTELENQTSNRAQDRSAPGQATAGQAGAGQSAAGQAAAGQSAEGQATTGQNGAGQSTQGAAAEQSANRGANQSANQSANTTTSRTPSQSTSQSDVGVTDFPIATSDAWLQQQQWLWTQQHYLLKGRVNVRFSDEVQQGDFRLEVNGARYVLRLSGPFGLGAVTLEGDGQRVIMSSTRHDSVEIRDVDVQLRQMLGYPVPVEALKYWALGVEQPFIPAKPAIDPDYPRLMSLEQAGWQITYKEYKRFGEHVLPRKIDLLAPDVKIKMVIRSWQFDL